MNVWMDEIRRESSSPPWLELVKLEPAAETGCGSYRVPFSSFVLMSGFTKKQKNQRKETLGTVSRDTL